MLLVESLLLVRFKFDEKAAVEAAESTMKIGEDFDKVTIENGLKVEGEAEFSEFSVAEGGSLSTNTIKPTSGETVNFEGKVSSSGLETSEITIGASGEESQLSIYPDKDAIVLSQDG